MRADTIAPGDVLTDPATGSLVYTVLDVLPADHPTHRLATDEPHVTILVRYACEPPDETGAGISGLTPER